MKKKALMGLVLLAIIGTSAVFAQEPTLDKLSFQKTGSFFRNNPNIISITFQQSNTRIDGSTAFPGDLVAKYRAGGLGTYMREAGSNTWTK